MTEVDDETIDECPWCGQRIKIKVRWWTPDNNIDVEKAD